MNKIAGTYWIFLDGNEEKVESLELTKDGKVIWRYQGMDALKGSYKVENDSMFTINVKGKTRNIVEQYELINGKYRCRHIPERYLFKQ